MRVRNRGDLRKQDGGETEEPGLRTVAEDRLIERHRRQVRGHP
jgi:hypothetical protein